MSHWSHKLDDLFQPCFKVSRDWWFNNGCFRYLFSLQTDLNMNNVTTVDSEQTSVTLRYPHQQQVDTKWSSHWVCVCTGVCVCVCVVVDLYLCGCTVSVTDRVCSVSAGLAFPLSCDNSTWVDEGMQHCEVNKLNKHIMMNYSNINHSQLQ